MAAEVRAAYMAVVGAEHWGRGFVNGGLCRERRIANGFLELAMPVPMKPLAIEALATSIRGMIYDG